MATEQNGVSPATAGGASAPDLRALGAAFQRILDEVRQAYEAVVPPVVEAEILPDDSELRGIADHLHAMLGEANCVEGHVTIEHVRYLLRVVEGHMPWPQPPQPDPRDAEIGLSTVRRLIAQRDNIVVHRNRLRTERDEAREEWKRADAEVTRLRDEVKELEKQRDYALRCHSRVAAGRKEAREERDDYAQRLRDTDKAYADVAAERDHLRADRDAMATAIGAVYDAVQSADEKLWSQYAKPKAAPRRWVAGDAAHTPAGVS